MDVWGLKSERFGRVNGGLLRVWGHGGGEQSLGFVPFFNCTL
jgi:hypothetical protein